MKAEFLCVGSELLLGQITDTNSVYMAQGLARAGVDLYRKTTVGDNLGRISDAITQSLERADCLIITGGLGPTTDDLTREAIAKALAVELDYDERLGAGLKELFDKRGWKMGETFLRQAYLPRGTKELPNPVGTAPGVWFDGQVNGRNKLIFAVPGVPKEMKRMFDETIVPALLEKSEGERMIIVSRVLRAFGIGESALADPLEDILTTSTNPTVAPLIFGNTEVHLRLTAKTRTEPEAMRLLDDMEARIRVRVGRYIFGRDDQTLPQVLVKMLTGHKATLSVAESLTGGMIGSFLTEATGASSVFLGGVIVYAPALKSEMLGVDEATIEAHTVVSQQVAHAMALGAQKQMNSTYALAVTGEAGPDSATGAPVGTVYIGLALPDQTAIVEHRDFFGDRDAIRRRSALAALDLLRRHLHDNLEA